MPRKTSMRPKPRNAAPRRTRPRSSSRRNAAPARDKPLARIGQALAGGAITASAAPLLALLGASPEAAVGVIGAVGLGLSTKGDGEVVRNVGTSMLVSSCTKAGELIYDKMKSRKTTPPAPAPESAPKTAARPSNAAQIPPEMVRAAVERARMRIALEQEASEPRDWAREEADYAA